MGEEKESEVEKREIKPIEESQRVKELENEVKLVKEKYKRILEKTGSIGGKCPWTCTI